MRQHPRYTFNFGSEWTCSLNQSLLFGHQIIDIGPWGAGVSVTELEAQRPGDVVSLTLFRRGDLQFIASGLVRWTKKVIDELLPVSMGLQFVDADSMILPLWNERILFKYLTVKYNPMVKAGAV